MRVPTRLKALLYSALGENAYAMLRVPQYFARIEHTIRVMRAGGMPWYEEREMRFVASRLPGLRLFVDVGVYLGDFALPVARLVPSATVVAVEAVPSTFAALSLLKTLTRAKNVELHQVAAGPESGTIDIAVELVGGAPSPMGSSTARTWAGAKTHRVAMRTVDELLHGREAQLVKIDVECAEEGVLAGMTACLRAGPAVICELFHEAGPHRERRDRVLAWMTERGYTAHLLDEQGRPVAVTPARLEELQREHSLFANYVFLRASA